MAGKSEASEPDDRPPARVGRSILCRLGEIGLPRISQSCAGSFVLAITHALACQSYDLTEPRFKLPGRRTSALEAPKFETAVLGRVGPAPRDAGLIRTPAAAVQVVGAPAGQDDEAPGMDPRGCLLFSINLS